MRRRDLLAAGAALAAGAGETAWARPWRRAGAWWFYASVGSRLFGFTVDPERGALRQVYGPIAAAEEIQSCCQHPGSGRVYVASSDLNTRRRGRHYLEAFAMSQDGGLSRIGDPVPLTSRPIDVTVDLAGGFVLTAHNRPAAVQVHPVGPDGGLEGALAQAPDLDFETYPHQVRLFPDQQAVLVPARGNDASRSGPEDPGALKVYSFAGGRLGPAQSVSPGGGLGFRPRHAVFHPGGRWLYVDLESQNQVQTYAVQGDRISPAPLFTASALSAPASPGQLVSAILVHPDGRTLYVANRGAPAGADRPGGENSVSVFRIDGRTGEPRLVQSAPIAGVHARTMAISPDGRWLVAAPIQPAAVRRGGALRTEAGGLHLFRVARDGLLNPCAKLDLDTAEGPVFWAGAFSAPRSA